MGGQWEHTITMAMDYDERMRQQAAFEESERANRQRHRDEAAQPTRMVELLEAILAEQRKQTSLLEAIATQGSR
jgi:hypothetical protein